MQIQKKPKSSHSILSILIFFLPFLLANKVEPNEFSFFDKRANTPKIKWIVKYLAFIGEFILAKATYTIIIDIFIISIYTMKGTREGSERREREKGAREGSKRREREKGAKKL